MSTRLLAAFGLWRCSRGHHAPLEWYSLKQRPMVNLGGAQEIMWASFGYALAKWNGWCPRCQRPIEWSDAKPRRAVSRGTAERGEP